MACAVEEASVVLLCFSEKYKDSPNCRTGYCYLLKQCRIKTTWALVDLRNSGLSFVSVYDI